MATIQEVDGATVKRIAAKIRDLQGSTSLEQAAQKCVVACYQEFQETLVLARLFATVEFAQLPDFNRTFVSRLARDKQVAHLIQDATPVLSLLGTCGAQSLWNDRRRSEGHVGIPLVSQSFVESIPMVSRLFQELGSQLGGVGKLDATYVSPSGNGLAKVFHVPEAKTAVDAAGRHVISAQTFVASHSIQTVFGVGGSYLDGTMMAIVFFTRESVERSVAERFMPLANVFKAATTSLVMARKIFD